MLIDPRRYRKRPPPAREDGGGASPVAVVALAVEVAALRDLAGWEPVGALLEELPAAVQGRGGLTFGDVVRLRVWAANWRALARCVRDFYAEHHAEPDIEPGLRYVLGTGTQPTGATLGRLRRAFIDLHGHEPTFDLLPRPATQETPCAPR